MTDLNPKQKVFCEEYLIDLNATQAAIRAGYSKKTANVQAAQLLAKLNIQARVEQLKQKRSEKTGVTVDWVVSHLRELVEICMAAKPVMIKEKGELIESGEYKIDSYGANKAMELLGKHLAMFVEPEKGISDINVNVAFGFGDENLQGNISSSTNRIKRFKVDG